MDEVTKTREAGHHVICPACDGTGRNGPVQAVCTLCWMAGVVSWWRYEQVLAEQRRRGGEPCGRGPEPEEPETGTGAGAGSLGLAA